MFRLSYRSAAVFGVIMMASSNVAMADEPRLTKQAAASIERRDAADASASGENEPTSYDFESYGDNRMNSPG